MVCVCMVILLLPLSTLAAPPEDGELLVHYPYAGVTFHIYKVASFDEKTGYELEEPFAEYEDTIEGLDRLGALDSDEWRILSYTLEHLVGADNIEPTRTMVTDQNGNLVWEGIPKGLYLILALAY